MRWGVGRAVILFVLIIVAISSIDWTQQTQIHQSESPTDMRSLKADYFLEQFHTIRYNAQGNSEYILKGEKLLHFPAKAASQLNSPELEFLPDDSPHWVLTSKEGWFEESDESFTLLGDVSILRSEYNQQPEVSIATQGVTVFTNEQIIQSSEAVEVFSQSWNLSADGFSSDLNNGRLSLLSNVRVHYEITP